MLIFPDAVKDARANAKINGVKNIQFYQNDAGKFMVQMAAQEGKGAIDVVFMDPPRAGSDEAFMSSVVKLAPKNPFYFIICHQLLLMEFLQLPFDFYVE